MVGRCGSTPTCLTRTTTEAGGIAARALRVRAATGSLRAGRRPPPADGVLIDRAGTRSCVRRVALR
jgi:hypothetical protein